jgi:hypothetical protein
MPAPVDRAPQGWELSSGPFQRVVRTKVLHGYLPFKQSIKSSDCKHLHLALGWPILETFLVASVSLFVQEFIREFARWVVDFVHFLVWF